MRTLKKTMIPATSILATPANDVDASALGLTPALVKCCKQYITARDEKATQERIQKTAGDNLKAAMASQPDGAIVTGGGFKVTFDQADGGGIDWKALALSLGATEAQIDSFQAIGSRRLHVAKLGR